MLVDHCLPKKPDCPETDKYIDLAKLVLKFNPGLLTGRTDDGDTILIKACERGSLPHVKFFLELAPGLLEEKNNLGNTALWISCMKGYPCIITELLDRGADINSANIKGNVPLYSVCQKGPKKVAEQLLSRGATVDHINTNGDTLILICCRNGQHEILDLLLQYVEPDFVEFKAHIDGFNAIFASVEANKPECIKVLHKYGINLNQLTDSDNQILAGASPLHLSAYYNRVESCNTLINLGAYIDQQDVNGQTPLHTAVIQGIIPIVNSLVRAGANLMIQDSWGNTPLAYCRDREDIKKLLINPALTPLTKLACNQFVPDDEKAALTILLSKELGIPGCLSISQVIDVSGHDGVTPLMTAIIHSNYNVAKTLLDIGSDPLIKNIHGINSVTWAYLTKNPRLINLVKPHTPDNDAVQRVVNASKISAPDALTMFVGQGKPSTIIQLDNSGISNRMEYYINLFHNEDVVDSMSTNELLATIIPDEKSIGPMGTTISKTVTSSTDSFDSNPEFQNFLWKSKIHTINLVASGTLTAGFTPQHLRALSLYTNNNEVFKSVNNTLLEIQTNTSYTNSCISYIRYLLDILRELTEFAGETFAGANTVNRKLFQIGSTVCFPTLVTSSTMWRVATEHLTEYASKKNGTESSKKASGTVFIIKSKTGKFIGKYSTFSFDNEVIFMPFTKFIVTNWYRGGDYIVLGQSNIRVHTYGVKSEEIDTYLGSQKSLVIELQEI
jgi:ankyrin repeat protein